MSETKKNFVYTCIVLLVVIGCAVGVYFAIPESVNSVPQAQPKASSAKVMEISNRDVIGKPTLFPDDMPIPKDATVVKSYGANSRDSKVESIERVYQTRDSVVSMVTLYQTYFDKNGWNISLVDKADPDNQSMTVAKEGTVATVTVKSKEKKFGPDTIRVQELTFNFAKY